jgi:hypothetical protein
MLLRHQRAIAVAVAVADPLVMKAMKANMDGAGDKSLLIEAGGGGERWYRTNVP